MNQLRSKASAFCISAVVLTFAVISFGHSASAQDTRLYYFTSANCPPCKQMAPVISALQQRGHQVSVIDIEAQPKWKNHFKVSSTPTCIVVSNNVVYGRQSGIISLQRLEQALAKSTEMARAATQNTTPSRTASPNSSKFETQNFQRRATAASNSKQSNVDRSATGGSYVSVPSRLSPKERAFRATVRLRVEDPEGISHGTGTIVHVRGEHALVLTCGHIFRDSKGTGVISIDYGFADQQIRTTRGQLLASDWNSRDVALVTCRLEQAIEPVPLGQKTHLPSQGDEAFSVGCSHGKNPTLLNCRVKRTARYGLQNDPFMAMKIDTTVQPKDGRSGGGLFDSNGNLIGVCNAAAQDLDEGIYSALENVHWQLAKSNLASLFQSNQGTQRAMAQQTPPVRPQGRQTEQPEEWVITVQSRRDGQSFTIRNPSRQLLERLAMESQGNPNQRIATRPQDMPDVRGIPERSHRQIRAQSPR